MVTGARALIVAFLAIFCVRQARAISAFGVSCLAEHNKYRERNGAPPLVWDGTLEAHAKAWAKKLSSGRLPPGVFHDMRSREGENIAIISEPTCEEALSMWMDEFIDYKDEGYCANPPRLPPYHLMHFTQVTWKATRRLGVAVSGNWLVARYSPSGNWGGQFGRNVEC
ncbi:Golgi-associated plant pathogenesis-related protein 1 [Nematostella vectensis]|uniref:Golgi-associated plant pathogenesis-related protein 1 n=1 Tax=Nematostella vectensis TaxID=45351 RepID=UPI0020776EA6|nr:Golgi-associated plant pathogenesis-related protein 1 [Nematostella vectensis]